MNHQINIITGHYGSGKTNLAVNMALDHAKKGERVTIVDLDIVNPYFRTADFKNLLEQNNIRLIAPAYANTNLDIPSLPPDIHSIFREDAGYVVVDVGGDDAGAIALGQFSSQMKESGYEMYYVINERRYRTKDAVEAVQLLREIELVSRLSATKLVNNTNLGRDTDLALVSRSEAFADEVSRLTGLPVAFTSMAKEICPDEDGYYGIEIYVKTSWEI